MNKIDTIDPQPRRVDAESLKAAIVDKLAYAIGKDPIVAQPHDWLAATILVVRDRAIDRWMDTTRATYRTEAKRVYYLSVEFLIGRLLRDAMSNLGLVEPISAALRDLGVSFDAIEALEEAIGTKLLHRTHKGVTLTPSGQAFVQHARQVLG